MANIINNELLSVEKSDIKDGKYVIPHGVERIGKSAFCGCVDLTDIEIPNSVTIIGEAAFSGCQSLKKVELPNSLISMGPYAFAGCAGLESVTISEGLDTISDCAFHACGKLSEVVLPQSVKSIGQYAFYDCASLKNFSYQGLKKSFASYFGSWLDENSDYYRDITDAILKKILYQGGVDIDKYLADISFRAKLIKEHSGFCMRTLSVLEAIDLDLAEKFKKNAWVLIKDKLLKSPQNFSDVFSLIRLFGLFESDYESRLKQVLDLFQELDFDSIHRMFDGVQASYNERLYKFLIDNFELITYSESYQHLLKSVIDQFDAIDNFFVSQGMENYNYEDALQYLDGKFFNDVPVGKELLAKEIFIAGVRNQEKFDYYLKLDDKVRDRHLSAIPRFNRQYSIDGYTVEYEILPTTSSLNYLVGETNYTRCCQVMGGAAQESMEHASTSPYGGILCTYLVENGSNKKRLLTQSWVWARSGVLCLDDIEATKIGEKHKMLINKTLCNFGKDIVDASINQINAYMSASDNGGQDILNGAIRKVIVGDTIYNKVPLPNLSCNVQVMHPLESEGQEYSGYTDAGETQRIIYQSSDYYDDFSRCTPVIYCDKRREYKIYDASSVPTEVVGEIIEMEGKYYDESIVYECIQSGENIRIILGEDYYLLYSVTPDEIVIYDLLRFEPRKKREESVQERELTEIFEELVSGNKKISVLRSNWNDDRYTFLAAKKS